MPDKCGAQNVGLREVQESVLTDHAASRRSEPAPAQTKPFACACVSVCEKPSVENQHQRVEKHAKTRRTGRTCFTAW